MSLMGSRMGSQSFNANRRGRPNGSIGALSKDYYSVGFDSFVLMGGFFSFLLL
jgi:hypothetical protein